MKPNKKAILPIKILFSVILLIIIFVISSSADAFQFNSSEDTGRLQAQLTARIRETLSIWAIIKGVSAIISTLESVQIEAGVSFGAQATASINPVGGLAVIDNTLDQVSNILLWAIGALSALKILLAISIWISLKIFVPVCGILIIAVLWNKNYSGRLIKIVAGIAVICLGICFAVPLALEMSNVVKTSILAGQIYRTTNEITSLSSHIEKEGEEINKPSFLNMIRRGISSVANFFQGIKQYIDKLIENIIDYIMIFIVINILIPVAALFGLKVLIAAVLKYIGFSLTGMKSLNASNQHPAAIINKTARKTRNDAVDN